MIVRTKIEQYAKEHEPAVAAARRGGRGHLVGDGPAGNDGRPARRRCCARSPSWRSVHSRLLHAEHGRGDARRFPDRDARSRRAMPHWPAATSPHRRARTESSCAKDSPNTLPELAGPFDLAFFDADKRSYVRYLDSVLQFAVINNAEDAAAIRTFNSHVASRADLIQVMLTVRAGLRLIRRAQTG